MNNRRKFKEDDIMNANISTEVERYCTVEESLIESLKEMKLMREGKLKGQTWREYRQASKEEKTKKAQEK
jgi:hypothetical protein